jgi:hypothetical protein
VYGRIRWIALWAAGVALPTVRHGKSVESLNRRRCGNGVRMEPHFYLNSRLGLLRAPCGQQDPVASGLKDAAKPRSERTVL